MFAHVPRFSVLSRRARIQGFSQEIDTLNTEAVQYRHVYDLNGSWCANNLQCVFVSQHLDILHIICFFAPNAWYHESSPCPMLVYAHNLMLNASKKICRTGNGYLPDVKRRQKNNARLRNRRVPQSQRKTDQKSLGDFMRRA